MKSKFEAVQAGLRHRHPEEAEDHLNALSSILEKASSDATQLFDHCLNLLVQQLKVDRAVMVRQTDMGLETFWWAEAKPSGLTSSLHAPEKSFCPLVLKTPNRSLVIRNARADSQWAKEPGFTDLGLNSYIGAALREGGRPIGVLSVQHGKPRDFSRSSIALVNAMANFLSRTMEVEALKHELRLTRDSLDLTSAVVEDSALQSATSGLPNQRYLEVWLRANLFMARRRGEPMAVVLWHWPEPPRRQQVLNDISSSLRGEDLLVDISRDRFLLLLPHTPQSGAEILIGRIREQMGEIAMGGTFWETELDDIQLHMAQQRCAIALQESLKKPDEAFTWRFLRPEDVENPG
jgi:GGDEF domain-containing protein